MSHKAWIVVVLVAFVIAVGAALLVSTHPVAPEAAYPEPVEVKDLSGTVLYASGEHGFTLMYPASAIVSEEPFVDPDRFLAGYQYPSEKSAPFPYLVIMPYESEDGSKRVQMRVTLDHKAKVCTDGFFPGRGTETETGVRDINGITWHAYEFHGAGTTTIQGIRYRTLRGNTCFELETITVSPGEEIAPSVWSSGMSKEETERANDLLEAIVSTFRFIERE